jgi:carboxypeptidase C (cathepsin A)
MSAPDRVIAADTPDKTKQDKQRERVEKLLVQAFSHAEGSITLSGKRLDYTVSSGFLPVVAAEIEGKGEPDAAVFHIVYSLKGADAAARPIMFVFNGGPGSSSVWLHLGALGPKRVAINEDGTMPPPPYAVQDNAYSWFEHFDLVFIDPPHTGYSLTASEEARKKMLGLEGDVDALAECIRLHLSRAKRWSSPVYLAGESYGTTRGAALADKLQDLGVSLAGVVLVSLAMDFQTLIFGGGAFGGAPPTQNDLPYATFLPAFACVAQYHGKLKGAHAASPQAARAAAQAFVFEDYLAALHQGARLSEKERARIAKRVAELIGLPPQLVADSDLRINDATFFAELLREEGKTVGRLEARVTRPMGAAKSRLWEFDPGIEALFGPYTMAANAYMSEVLNISTDQRYEVINMQANKAWDYGKANRYANTSGALASALRRNPHLQVLVASGYYDLGTPYSGSDYQLARLNVPADVMRRITHHYYEAGHMMYTRTADLKKLKDDVARWLAR